MGSLYLLSCVTKYTSSAKKFFNKKCSYQYKVKMLHKLGAKILSGPGLGLVGAAGAGVVFGTRFGLGPVRLLAESSSTTAGTIYQFSAKDINGQDVDMGKYRGQVCV